MNAKDFAPSLFATASLVEASAEVMYGVKDAVTVHVQADFRRGSFHFDLIAAATVVGHQLFQNLSLSDLETLLRFIGFRAGESNNLFAVLRRIGGRSIERTEPEQGSNNVTVTVTGDNATIVIGGVPAPVAKMLTSESVREAVPAVVAPVGRPGIESYRVGEEDSPTILVTKDDLPALQAAPLIRAELTDDTSTTAIELLMPNFVEGNKWRVAQGGSPFWVRILDEQFLASMDEGAAFRKGDYLIVQLRTTTYATLDGLQVDRDVIRVLDHRQRSRQLPLLQAPEGP